MQAKICMSNEHEIRFLVIVMCSFVLAYIYHIIRIYHINISSSGYIAVELAGVLNGLGTDTSLFVRGDKALRTFDTMLSTHLDVSIR